MFGWFCWHGLPVSVGLSQSDVLHLLICDLNPGDPDQNQVVVNRKWMDTME